MLLAVKISRPPLTNLPLKRCRANTGSGGQDFTDVDTEGVAMKTSVRWAFRSIDNLAFTSSTVNTLESKRSKNRRKSVFLADIFG